LTTSSPPNCTPVSSVKFFTPKFVHCIRTVGQSIELVRWNVYRWLGQAEERHNGLARVTTNNRDRSLRGVLLASDVCNEGLSTDDIEGGDTEEPLGVVDTLGLVDFGADRNRRVDL
jgi:hypothetical protein